MSPSETTQSPSPGWTVTISRQMGSLGTQVSQSTAKLLNYRLARQELIQAAALRAGAPEMMLAFIDDLGLLDVCPSPESCLAFRQAIAELMHEYARSGNVVIIGRAGQVILKNHPSTLHVRLISPLPIRVERVASAQAISAAAALAQIEASDRNRQSYLHRFYQVRWDDACLYHLVLNTAHFSPDQAARLIQAALLEMRRAASLPTPSRSIS